MSVAEVILTGASLGGNARGTDPSKVARSYRVTYRVRVDNQLDTPDMILDYFKLTTSLPWIGRRFKIGSGVDTDVICTDVDAQNIENGGGWYTVGCRFEDEETAGGLSQAGTTGTTAEGKATEDPLQWHPEIEVSYTQISEPAYTARFHGFEPKGIVNKFLTPGMGRPVVNSAMVPYDPTIEADIHIKVVRITVNLLAPPWAMYDVFQGTINSTVKMFARPDLNFRLIIEPYCGKLVSFGASLSFENGRMFWRETKEIHIHPRSWIRQILDRGMNRRVAPGDPDGAGGDVTSNDILPGMAPAEPIKDVDGYPISEPVLFDGNGQPLRPLSRKPVYLLYQPETDLDWAPIPF